jgi:hypothetical protein
LAPCLWSSRGHRAINALRDLEAERETRKG